ncbi:MAG: hypothetical protein Kow00117_17610 [Phototrophicales bacterium]
MMNRQRFNEIPVEDRLSIVSMRLVQFIAIILIFLAIIGLFALIIRQEADALRVLLLGGVIGSSGVILYLANMLDEMVKRARRNADLLTATAEVGQITAKILDLDELFNRAVELIRDRFAYYHVQIFMVDDTRTVARLVASTGDVGQKLVEGEYQIRVGSRSVIGRVTQVGEPLIVHDTSQDPMVVKNDLLPATRSELALPILDGDRIIGALDVQSTRVSAFKLTDIQALQVMTTQLGTAIRNARLFEAQSTSLQENKRLFFESEANLREIQRLNRQLTRKVWGDYLQQRQTLQGITLTLHEVQEQATWTPDMIQASQRRRPIVNEAEEGGKRTIAVPIALRGEVIGAIEIEPDPQARTDDLVEMLQAVAQRLAISLDNARLFEEAQQSAIQEQRINEIVTQYQSAATVDDLLQITIKELTQTLGAEAGMIRLGVLSPENNNHEDKS